MKNTKELKVSIQFNENKITVGRLLHEGKKIFFKYDTDFIERGLQISPFKLPLSNDVLLVNTAIFDGLFGVFHDSLPDGWGRLLLDRSLITKGHSLDNISALDRLALVGNNGMGALSYEPVMGIWLDNKINVELDLIQQESKQILEGTSSELIEELLRLGGSSGGDRPKILVGFNKKTNHLIHGQKKLSNNYEHWIIKFNSATDFYDSAQIEYTYHKMALAAGIEMTECHLFKGSSGRQYFGTKRFDRIGNHKMHLHSAAGLLHDNFRLSNIDYGHIMDAAFKLENHIHAYEKVLRLAAFNVFTHNRDDHSKNISFLMDKQGNWQLSPAYDLTFSFSSHGFHSTTIAGEGRSPGIEHLMELANVFGIKNAKGIITQVKDVTLNWKKYAQENGVSKASIKLIDDNMII